MHFCDLRNRGEYGAILTTVWDPARLSQPRRRRRNFPDKADAVYLLRLKLKWRDSGKVTNEKTAAQTAFPTRQKFTNFKLSRTSWRRRDFPRRRRRNFPDKADAVYLLRLKLKWRDSGKVTNEKTAAQTAFPTRQKFTNFKLSRTSWRRRDFRDQGGDGATKKQLLVTFANALETVRISRPR